MSAIASISATVDPVMVYIRVSRITHRLTLYCKCTCNPPPPHIDLHMIPTRTFVFVKSHALLHSDAYPVAFASPEVSE